MSTGASCFELVVESPESPHTQAVLQGQRGLQLFTLALILSRQSTFHVIWHFKLWSISVLSDLWGPLCRSRANLSCCHTCHVVTNWFVTADNVCILHSQTMPKHTTFLFLTWKHRTVLWSPFSGIISNTIWQQQYLILLPERLPSFRGPHPLAWDFRTAAAYMKSLHQLLPCVKLSMQPLYKPLAEE